MLYILHSPGWKPITFGKYKSGEGMQKDEVAVHQDQSHQPHLLAPKGFADSTCYTQREIGLSQDQPTTIYISRPALCLFSYVLCTKDEFYTF